MHAFYQQATLFPYYGVVSVIRRDPLNRKAECGPPHVPLASARSKTAAVWADCVVWTEDDSLQQVYQDESGRLWDVVYMASHAIRTRRDSGDRLLFQLYRVPRDGRSSEAVITTLKLIVGPGDAGEPVITILLPQED